MRHVSGRAVERSRSTVRLSELDQLRDRAIKRAIERSRSTVRLSELSWDRGDDTLSTNVHVSCLRRSFLEQPQISEYSLVWERPPRQIRPACSRKPRPRRELLGATNCTISRRRHHHRDRSHCYHNLRRPGAFSSNIIGHRSSKTSSRRKFNSVISHRSIGRCSNINRHCSS